MMCLLIVIEQQNVFELTDSFEFRMICCTCITLLASFYYMLIFKLLDDPLMSYCNIE